MGDSIDRAAVRRNTWWLLFVVIAVSLAGIVVAFLLVRPGRQSSHHSPAVTVLAVIVPVLVVAASAALMLWLLRRPSYRRILQYGWSERRAVYNAIRSGRPLSRREVRVAEAQLDSVQRTRWVTWLHAVTAALLLVSGLGERTAVGWFMVAAGGLNLALVPFQVWQRGRTLERYRAALARTEPPPAPAE